MVNHLLHGAIPIKFAFVVAIFAVVETSGAVGMGGTLVVGSERHATTLAKLWQLPFLQMLFFCREGGIEAGKIFRIFVGYEICSRRVVGAGSAVEVAGNELLSQEVGHFSLFRFAVIVDADGACHHKACMAVKSDFAFHTQDADTHFLCFFNGIGEEFQPVAFALVIGMNADGTKRPSRNHRAIFGNDGSLAIHHMAYDFAIFFHHEVEFRDEVGVVAEVV